MKFVGVVAIVAVGFVGFEAYRYFGHLSRSRIESEAKVFDKDFMAGKAKPIEGPYVESGNPADLQFKVVSLEGLESHRLAFNGDLLCLVKDSVKPKEWRVLRSDGTRRDLGKAIAAHMTATGATYLFQAESESSTAGVEIKPDGQKVVYDGSNSFGNQAARQMNLTIGTQGYTDRGSAKTGKFVLVDFDLKAHELEVPGGGSLFLQSETGTLGDVGCYYDRGGGNAQSIGFLLNGNLSQESLPMPHEYCRVTGFQSGIAITAGRGQMERIPYLRTGPGEYKRLQVPKGVFQAEVTAMNSKGDYMLLCATSCTHDKKHSAFPYDYAAYLVTDGKYYNLKDLQEAMFGSIKDPTASIYGRAMDDQGTLMYSAKSGSFLLKRIETK